MKGTRGLGWVLSVFFFFLLICFSGHLIDDSNSINNLCYIGGTPAIFLFSSQEWISLNKMSFELLLLSHPLFFSFFFFSFSFVTYTTRPTPPSSSSCLFAAWLNDFCVFHALISFLTFIEKEASQGFSPSGWRCASSTSIIDIALLVPHPVALRFSWGPQQTPFFFFNSLPSSIDPAETTARVVMKVLCVPTAQRYESSGCVGANGQSSISTNSCSL